MGGGGPKSFPFGRDGPTSGPRFDVQPQWQGCAGLHKNGGGRTFFLSSGVNEKSGRKPIEKPAFRNDFFRMLPGEYIYVWIGPAVIPFQHVSTTCSCRC